MLSNYLLINVVFTTEGAEKKFGAFSVPFVPSVVIP